MFGFLKGKRGEAAHPPAERADRAGFRMTVEDVFSVPGHGTVVTGTVECGTMAVKERALLVGAHGRLPVRIDGLERDCRAVKTARAGQRAGVLLRRVEHGQVEQGDCLQQE